VSIQDQIKAELKARNAVLVAHYYVSGDLQTLAEESGGLVSDSLEMARFGQNCDADTIIVAGVKFMGETAKILSPEKTILVLDEGATCSLDLDCPTQEFSDFCDEHPDRKVVVYANTSAEVKARADWVVTSGSALRVAKHLSEQGEKILWAPDKHLGHYVQMAMNTLDNCLDTLKTGKNEILINSDISKKAKQSIQKLLDFTA